MLTRRGLLLGSGAALATPTGLSAYMVGVEPMMANTTRYHLTPPGWPEDLQLRVVALAGFHCCEPFMTAARVRDLALSANALQPDLIVLLGEAKTLAETTTNATFVFAMAFLVVLMVLAAQFESVMSALGS